MRTASEGMEAKDINENTKSIIMNEWGFLFIVLNHEFGSSLHLHLVPELTSKSEVPLSLTEIILDKIIIGRNKFLRSQPTFIPTSLQNEQYWTKLSNADAYWDTDR